MNLEEWKSSTNAGRLAIRVLDLQIVDNRLDDYLKARTDPNRTALEAALQRWQAADIGGRATQFRAQGEKLASWIRGEHNAQVAMRAFTLTRSHYVPAGVLLVKSVNKRIFPFEDARDTPEHMQRVQASAQRHARAAAAFTHATRENPRATAQAQADLIAARAGNCSEMSRYSCDRINAYPNHCAGQFSFDWSGDHAVGEPDHVFFVVGNFGTTVGNHLPSDMKEWSELWVVDAWANICCAATDYPEAFERKANDWAAKNLKIYAPKRVYDPITGQYVVTANWIIPNKSVYLSALKYSSKKRIY